MDALLKPEVLVAIIGAIATVVTAALAILGQQLSRAKQTIDEQGAELNFQQAALSFVEFLSGWQEVDKGLKELFAETPIDRFLMLRAWNGKATPKWTTAFFQVRSDGQQPVQYVHFELDDDYVYRLQKISQQGQILFRTDEIPPSAIKDVYSLERVTQSAWFFIGHAGVVERPGASAITYCSFATHEDVPITEEHMTRCRLIVNRIQGLLARGLVQLDHMAEMINTVK